jgi:hypothetical protein
MKSDQMVFDFSEIDQRQSLEAFAQKSRELQELLRSRGYANGDGVAVAGLVVVGVIARRLRIKDWKDVSSLSDYDRLIAAVRESLDLHDESRALMNSVQSYANS